MVQDRQEGQVARAQLAGRSDAQAGFQGSAKIQGIRLAKGSTGDQALIGIGKILQEVMDKSGEVARISGDEFAIAGSKIQNKFSVETLMEALLLRLRQPLGVSGFDRQVTVSVGIALVLNPNTDASHVFGVADRAMYKVKFGSKAGYKITKI